MSVPECELTPVLLSLTVLLIVSPPQEWEALQQSIQRRERALLETKSKVTHPVYSLYFPEEKQEWWWLYIADRRDQTLVSMPYHVCTLKDTEEVGLHFRTSVTGGQLPSQEDAVNTFYLRFRISNECVYIYSAIYIYILFSFQHSVCY